MGLKSIVEKISDLAKYKSKLLNISIIKFYKAILRAKDEVFN